MSLAAAGEEESAEREKAIREIASYIMWINTVGLYILKTTSDRFPMIIRPSDYKEYKQLLSWKEIFLGDITRRRFLSRGPVTAL